MPIILPIFLNRYIRKVTSIRGLCKISSYFGLAMLNQNTLKSLNLLRSPSVQLIIPEKDANLENSNLMSKLTVKPGWILKT